MDLIKKLTSIILIAIFTINVSPLAYAQGPVNFANCRLGVGGVSSDVVGYNLAQLNLGLYLDWASRNSPPSGLPSTIQYLQVIRVHQTKADYGSGWFGPPRVYASPPSYNVSPSLSTLASRAANQPGSIWLVGNEIERVDWPQSGGWSGQDEITPELYATAYHDIHAVIKAADPTAKVAVGGIIQPTTLRLAYLDRMWNSYQAQYGYSMGRDIDLWNIHMFIIREVLNDWGGEIPAGFNNSDNDPTNNYNPADAFLGNSNYQTALNAHHNMTYYRQFLENFRAWMAAHGERDKMLLNTEFGILMDLDNPSVRNFLRNTFDYMFAATNPATGYSYDENRLVQGWLWYSLNDNFSPFQQGTLFNSSKSLTNVGNEWKNYVSDPNKPLASQPQRNLLVTNLRVELSPTSGATLMADVANSGNTRTATNNHIVVRFWNGPPNAPGSNLIAGQILADLPGCGSFTTAAANWPNPPDGDQTWYVQVVPIANETNPDDNIAHGPLSAPLDLSVYLPLILKN